jgi:hypothetical protein
MTLRSRMTLLAAVLCLPAACDGGGDDGDDGDAPACVTRDADACTPLYEPSWERVFAETIVPRCGPAGGACHGQASAAGAAGGLVVSDLAATRTVLLDDGFVVPGDAACSELMVRLDTDDDARRMPPGAQALDEAERCAVARWVAHGTSP